MSESLGLWLQLAVCAHRRLGRWDCPGLPGKASQLSRLFQDALLNLGSVIDIAGFQRAVKEALSAVLPRVVGALPLISPAPQTFVQPFAVPHTGLKRKEESGSPPRGLSWGSEGFG